MYVATKQLRDNYGEKTKVKIVNFELLMVLGAKRGVTVHFKPSHQILKVKNYLQTQTYIDRRQNIKMRNEQN